MRYVLTLLGCLFACNAYADRIPDYSFTPEETARQSSNTNYGTQPISGGLNNSATMPDGLAPENPAAMPSTYFMSTYCNQSSASSGSNDSRYAAIANCLREQRAQACSQFQQLPDDVKRVLDQTISCTSKALNGENPDAQTPADMQTTCNDTDGARLQLMKKYWRDSNTASAVLFLPDEVLNDSGKCMRGGV